MSVANKVWKQGLIYYYYSIMHCPSYITISNRPIGTSVSQACSYLCRDGYVGQCMMLSTLKLVILCLPLTSPLAFDFYEIFLLLACVPFMEVTKS